MLFLNISTKLKRNLNEEKRKIKNVVSKNIYLIENYNFIHKAYLLKKREK